MLAATLISHHNLAFYLDLMRRVRVEIRAGTYEAFRSGFLERTRGGEK
jgi:tRNA-guanine family transglycosylase